MNVLLISPEFPETFWNFKYVLKFIRKQAAFPPLGLLTVAALLPRDWGKRLVDLNVQALKEKDLEWADCAFIGAMTVQKDSAKEVIARCKKAGLVVVAGGPLFMWEREGFENVDHFVLNEAEQTLPPFLADLQAGRAQRVYATSEFPDLQLSPTPLWELADLKRYSSMSIQFSRGCPFKCDFCNVSSFLGDRVRTKTTAQIIAELDGLWNRGWKGAVFFADDNFIGNRHQLKTDLLPALIAWHCDKPQISFCTEASINLADDETLMSMMTAAGFDSVFVGIETPDESGLAECNKKQNLRRDLVSDVKTIQRAGLQVFGGFIVGFDSDTLSIFQRQIEFIQKSGIAAAMVSLLRAVPGTKLFDRLKQEGRIRGQLSGDNGDGTTNVVPRMGFDTLRDGYHRIVSEIYSPRLYYQRIKTFLREYKPPEFKTRPNLTRMRAFVRSTWRLGLVGRERFQYWKLLLWTGFRRREALPAAVTLMIYGHHFRRFYEHARQSLD